MTVTSGVLDFPDYSSTVHLAPLSGTERRHGMSKKMPGRPSPTDHVCLDPAVLEKLSPEEVDEALAQLLADELNYALALVADRLGGA